MARGPAPFPHADIMRAYADGRLSWSRLREETGLEDFGVILRRLDEEGLKLPRAPRDRSTHARQWLRDALAERASGDE